MLEGKVALITGSSRGIGAAAAIELAKHGALVVINYIQSTEKAEQVLEIVKQHSAQSILVQADVTKADDIKRLVDVTMNTYGQIDILVNNAHIPFPMKSFVDMQIDEFSLRVDSELRAIFNLCQQVVPYMQQQQSGKIIQIASSKARIPSDGFIALGTAKAAMIAMSKYLAMELGSDGIQVNVVSPGPVLTESSTLTDTALIDKMNKSTPMGRIATENEVAKAILYFASDLSQFVTGAYLPVSGGLEMS